ncbi:MAG: phosphatase PAP2 family protein [Phycisphaerae bacterium]|nr:phosphatase PAP2 family protein [Phycisphaerae bacterium]MDW8261533.1 phosphatase PAP2 family protein [Phycisphaerales bacterium]
MSWLLVIGLLAAAGVLIVLEHQGFRTTLSLSMRGDIKRESRFLAQYGQSVCAPLTALLVWELDATDPGRRALTILLASIGASLSGGVLKRLFGRVRPNRQHAGRFLGFTWRHANWRESFPSSHAAAAVAMSVVLAAFYPQAAETFWCLAIACAALRYLLDAHWPSDVLAGIALGYVCGWAAVEGMARYA